MDWKKFNEDQMESFTQNNIINSSIDQLQLQKAELLKKVEEIDSKIKLIEEESINFETDLYTKFQKWMNKSIYSGDSSYVPDYFSELTDILNKDYFDRYKSYYISDIISNQFEEEELKEFIKNNEDLVNRIIEADIDEFTYDW